MLDKLTIKNIALISESEILFGNGLNILSGETGAGKSLIIDSLNFILGARADKTMIKSGSEFASVQAVFSLTEISEQLQRAFEEIGIEPEQTIIIYRYLGLNGKTEVKINGTNVTNGMLKKITTHLVDLHGQHAHQGLLDVKNHLQILDSFDAQQTNQIKDVLQTQLNKLKTIDKNIASIGGAGQDRERNIELLQYQINEIEQANLQEEEEETLKQRKVFLLNAEKIFTALADAKNSLSEQEFNALTMLKLSLNNLRGVIGFDKTLQDTYDKMQALYYELLEQSETINDIANESEFDENELNEIEERLDLIAALKRKYGQTILQVLQYLQTTKQKLDDLLHAEEKLHAFQTERKKAVAELYDTCIGLHQTREQIAQKVQLQIVTQLTDLGMKNAKFEVVFNNNINKETFENYLTQSGADEVEFMFSANLGEPVKPLSKIISGGEMSRFMLAIKCVLNENNNKTFVFDEIDNGIGGITGTVVGQKLAQIAQNNQVVCVTHLAQIASFADEHFAVSKHVEQDKTLSHVVPLNKEGIVAEIARLLGANKLSDVGYLHAKEMLQQATEFKNN